MKIWINWHPVPLHLWRNRRVRGSLCRACDTRWAPDGETARSWLEWLHRMATAYMASTLPWCRGRTAKADIVKTSDLLWFQWVAYPASTSSVDQPHRMATAYMTSTKPLCRGRIADFQAKICHLGTLPGGLHWLQPWVASIASVAPIHVFRLKRTCGSRK